MNLDSLNTTDLSEKGTFLHLSDPSGKKMYDAESKKPIGFTCIGSDSKKFQRAQHKLQDIRTANIKVKGGKFKGLSAAQNQEDTTQLMSLAVTQYHYIKRGSPAAAVEMTRENTEQLFRDFPWMEEQVDEHVNDRENYLGE